MDNVETAANVATRELTNARFGQAPKMKVSKKEYADVIKSAYLLAQTNTAKDIRRIIKSGIRDNEDIEMIVADIEMYIAKSHNALATKTKLGRLSFNKMEVEDLMYDKPYQNLCKKPAHVL